MAVANDIEVTIEFLVVPSLLHLASTTLSFFKWTNPTKHCTGPQPLNSFSHQTPFSNVLHAKVA